MKRLYILSLLSWGILLFISTPLVAQTPVTEEPDTAPLIKKYDNGEVNWTEQYVEATGLAIIDTGRFKNIAQAKAMAHRGAVVVAQRNLLEIIQGIYINSETTVRDYMTESDIIKTKVEGVLKGATLQKGPKETNGTMEVVMRVPLYAGNSLAYAVYDKEMAKVAGSTKPIEETKVVEKVEEVKGVKKDEKVKDKSKKNAFLPENATNEQIQELFFNLSDGKIDPSLFPEIKDINGETIYKMIEQFDPTLGQFPEMVKISKSKLDKLKKDPTSMVVDVIRDNAGNLKLNVKNQESLNKWKAGAGKALKFAAGILF